MVKIGRRTTFNSAHRLHNDKWSDEKNQKVFGKCNSPNYHGHNYTLETWVEGEIDPETGFLIDLADLKQIIKEEIEEEFDHRNLNLDVPAFKDLNPTAENIAKVIYQKLKPRLQGFKLTVRLSETQNNMVEYSE
ncbi:6-pyruvoyl trahydropterin synthase family protein [Brumimicrobium aurantiacum]|uniref:6-carboxy-5,6,7,8-tetrahydropterin synthase n=1 Tax=Brumimicrobium aurantiacum TaxID=1737063 RepID=A0A3E1F1N4_9FLAO|nr:6-carboxytetrahydropterin synthase [Brumimicrobium aurantiacum]RFC55724.1 6-carboxytetrahydropterin synthase [Brumimicrobium aurantiacum]